VEFDLDIHAVQEWAKERFDRINFGFLGFPESEYGRVHMWPLRVGAVMESYYYHAASDNLTPPTILYLGSYGNFSRRDDILCTKLADQGYEVFGLDPLRYLLHASVTHRLAPDDLHKDFHSLVQMLPNKPIIIGRPLAAGLALLWATNIADNRGVIAIGLAQSGFHPGHIFQNQNPYNFMLSRLVGQISPRPTVLVQHTGHKLGGDENELGKLFQNSKSPRLLEKAEKLSSSFLIGLIHWIEKNQ
jgi:hypothetical protein